MMRARWLTWMVQIAFLGFATAAAAQAPDNRPLATFGPPVTEDVPATASGANLGIALLGVTPAQDTEPAAPPPVLPLVAVDHPAAETPRSNWIDKLPYRPIPPLGNYPILPSGPGYYSLLDVLTGHYRQEPPRSAYPLYALMRNSMFDADFRYLDDPSYVSEDFFDRFHNVHVGDWLLGTGGQMDTRYMHQENARLSGLTDDYNLLRAAFTATCGTRTFFAFMAKSSGPARPRRICRR